MNLGIKQKIMASTIGLIFATSAGITLFSYKKSSEELTAAVETGNLSIAQTVSAEIGSINEREFTMLESLANLSIIRSTDIDMYEEWKLVNSAVTGNDKYIGLGFFNEKGIGYSTTGDYHDMHERDYLVISMQGRRALMDPDWSATNGRLSTFYAVPVKDMSGRQIAEISAVVDATDSCRTMQDITVGKKSHPFVISRKSGKYVAHENSQFVADGKIAVDNVSAGFRPIIQQALAGGIGTNVFYDESTKQKYAVSYRPIDNSEWTAVCYAPYNDFYQGISLLLKAMVVITVIALIIATVVAFAVVTAAVKPLKRVSEAINDIASGEADLTKRLKMATKDEIGEVVDGFKAFSKKLQNIIGDVKHSKDDLLVAGEDMAAVSEDTASSITQIIANIESMYKQIDNQSQSVSQTAGAVNEIASNIESLERMIESQSNGVSQASAAVEEMIGNISSVNASMDKMTTSFHELRENSQIGFIKQQSVNDRVQQIEQQSAMLQEANAAISAIAEQTNLLAMNAAIEAAHAGDAGKGFAVVADEIRKLSETSTSQSKTIGDQLNNIKNSINEVVSASGEASAAFEIVSGKLEETDALVMQIKAAMEEQNEGSQQITGALHHMNDSTIEVRTASAEMAEGNKMILAEVQHLQNATTTMKGSMEEMAVGARRINETGATLSTISSKVQGSIVEIGTQVDQFKV